MKQQNCRYPCSPRPKRCRLAVSSIDPRSGVANALSRPPGKYERKLKTQRNRRGLAQAVEHEVQFDSKRGTLPGLEMLVESCQKRWPSLKDSEHRCCMVIRKTDKSDESDKSENQKLSPCSDVSD